MKKIVNLKPVLIKKKKALLKLNEKDTLTMTNLSYIKLCFLYINIYMLG